MLMAKSYARLKANNKIFQFNFASFLFILTGNLFYTRTLYIWLP